MATDIDILDFVSVQNETKLMFMDCVCINDY